MCEEFDEGSLIILTEFGVFVSNTFPVLFILKLESRCPEDLHNHILRPLLKEDVRKTKQTR